MTGQILVDPFADEAREVEKREVIGNSDEMSRQAARPWPELDDSGSFRCGDVIRVQRVIEPVRPPLTVADVVGVGAGGACFCDPARELLFPGGERFRHERIG
jgi:hypothetical protein